MVKNKLYKRILSMLITLTLATGYYNSTVSALSNNEELSIKDTVGIEKIASFFTGDSSEDGGAAEIVKYNRDNNKFYVINGIASKIHIASLDGIEAGKSNLEEEKTIDVSSYVETEGFLYGDITSISISNERKEIAVSVQEKNYNKNGKVVVIDYDGNLKRIFECGVQPDMITYTPDSKFILVANEGEPRNGYGEGVEDPQGSVTIIDVENNTSKLVTFEKFDDIREQLISNKVILKKDSKPSEDLEPEYIAVDSQSKLAYVSLQENNAIATLDIEKGEFISVKGLGFKDHSLEDNALDVVKDDKIEIKTQENLYGVYMPDGISIYDVNGKSYILTANEGDGREYITKEFPHIQPENEFNGVKSIKIEGQKVDALDPTKYDGLDENKNYVFGGRSFSIWDAETMEQVYDSGSEFENVVAQRLPQFFNCSNKNLTLDNRSGKKGPEPEEVRVGKVGDKIYAFIGIERVGGVMVYDITNPLNVKFANYTNTREFTTDIAGDVSTEGIDFIPAEVSKTGYPLAVVANEVSGTVSILEVRDGYVKPENVVNKEVAQIVIDKINSIPAEITLKDRILIIEAREAFEGLTEAQKALVTNLDKLLQAEDVLRELEIIEAEKEEDEKAAKEVEVLIEALPQNITLEDKSLITKVRQAFDGLTDKQKSLVSNVDKLLEAEAIIAKIENSDSNNSSNNNGQNNNNNNESSNTGKLPNTGAATGSGTTILIGAITAIAGAIVSRKKK